MISIDKVYFSEYVIQKSKFFSYAYPVFDENKCKEILDELREKYNDATHVCFAYILSTPRVEKCSDDGEPTGTAGKPIIELLKKKKLEKSTSQKAQKNIHKKVEILVALFMAWRAAGYISHRFMWVGNNELAAFWGVRPF